MEAPITLHWATWRDAWALYTWRNDPAMVRACVTQARVSLLGHLRWFMRQPPRSILIARADGRRVGVVRGPCASISVYVAPEARGKGYSAVLLQDGVRVLMAAAGETGAWAQVRRQNTASIAAFRRAGWVYVGHIDNMGQFRLMAA
jgi:GNAT superfamily N-acetyltransferase